MILCIIQARMNSSRLPGKVLLDLGGRSVIEQVVSRVRQSAFIDQTVVATTTSPQDNVLVTHLQDIVHCEAFRGSETNVLDRFYHCAERLKPALVVRITADDPLKDPEIIDHAIHFMHEDPSLDYCSNTLQPTYPEGLDVEVFRFSALERAFREAKLPSEQEHVTPFIWKHPEWFRLRNFEFEEDLSTWRWTLDYPADLEFMSAVYRACSRPPGHFSFREVIAYLKGHPEISSINGAIGRNEGYMRSVSQDAFAEESRWIKE